MMNPLVGWEQSEVRVRFDGSAFSHFIDVVLDLNWEQDILGIEVLGLRSLCPNLKFPAQEEEEASQFSFDPEADGLYIRVAPGRTDEQIVRRGVVVVDKNYQVQEIRVEWDREPRYGTWTPF